MLQLLTAEVQPLLPQQAQLPALASHHLHPQCQQQLRSLARRSRSHPARSPGPSRAQHETIDFNASGDEADCTEKQMAGLDPDVIVASRMAWVTAMGMR